jgi:hypothetical protein
MELRLNPEVSLEFSPEDRRVSPTRVLTVSNTVKACIVLGLPVSFYSVFALVVFLPKPQPLRLALAFVCAIFCSFALFVFCWSSVFAYFIRKYNLSPAWCNWAGWPFMLLGIPVVVIGWFGKGMDMQLGVMLCLVGAYAARACRKLAYPATARK